MRLIPWYFASKYKTLEECDDVGEEVQYCSHRMLLPIILAGILLVGLMTASDYIEIPGLSDILILLALFTGILFGLTGALVQMVQAIDCRKEEIVEEMWDEGHPARGQRRED